MGRARYPFREIMDHMSEMARMREYAEGGGQEEGPRTHATAWVPTTDIFAKGDDLVIRCELAGVERDDVELSLSNGALIIHGERKGEPEAKRSEEHTSELQSRQYLVCRLLLEKKKTKDRKNGM